MKFFTFVGSAALLALIGCSSTAPAPEPRTAYIGEALPSSQTPTTSPTQAPTPSVQPTIAQVPGNGFGASSSEAPQIYATSAIMIDARTGEVLFSKNPDERRPVASTQKLLTGLILAESGGLDATVTVANSDTTMEPTKAGIKAGERYRRSQLLTAMMVKSCNDAAACLARDHSGSTTSFAGDMQRRAAACGATNSHFLNPHGLPAPGQYSTARDMSRIAFQAYRNPALRSMMRLPAYSFVHANGRVSTLPATNKLIGVYPGVNGMKTGYTSASGKCLVASAVLGNREVILVQLGSKSDYIFKDAVTMFAWAQGGGGRYAMLQ